MRVFVIARKLFAERCATLLCQNALTSPKSALPPQDILDVNNSVAPNSQDLGPIPQGGDAWRVQQSWITQGIWVRAVKAPWFVIQEPVRCLKEYFFNYWTVRPIRGSSRIVSILRTERDTVNGGTPENNTKPRSMSTLFIGQIQVDRMGHPGMLFRIWHATSNVLSSFQMLRAMDCRL